MPGAQYGARLFNYFSLIYQRHKLLVYPIVVFSFAFDKPKTIEPCLFEVIAAEIVFFRDENRQEASKNFSRACFTI